MIRYTEYREGDEKSILALFQIVFKKTMSTEFWNWRYLDKPNFKRTNIQLAWDEDKLVGHYAISMSSLSINTKVVPAGLSMTTMTHPEYAGKGIFSELASRLYKKKEFEGCPTIYGFPNNNSHRGFVKNLEWKDVEIIPSLILDDFTKRDSVSCLYSPIIQLEDRHMNHVENLLSDYNCFTKRDLEYYNWRFSKNSLNKYTILGSTSSDDFVVFKEYHTDKGVEIDLVEWSVSADVEYSISVLNSILVYLNRESVKRFNIWMPLKDIRHLTLEKVGFQNAAPLTYFAVRNTEQSIDSQNWYYQMSDSDVY